jgi:hypothetical protein
MKKKLLCIFFCLSFLPFPIKNGYTTESSKSFLIGETILFTGLNILLVNNPKIKVTSLYATNEVGNTLTGELGFIPVENLFGFDLQFHTSLGFYKGYHENFGAFTNELLFKTSLFGSDLLIGGGLSIWDAFSAIIPVATINYNILSNFKGIFENLFIGYTFGASGSMTHILKAGAVLNI